MSPVGETEAHHGQLLPVRQRRKGVREGHWGCAICAFLTLSSLAVARPTVWSRVDEDVRPLDCVPLGSVQLIPLIPVGMWVGGYHQLPPHTAGPWGIHHLWKSSPQLPHWSGVPVGWVVSGLL